VYKIEARKPEKKRILGELARILEDNIKEDLK
jgi:hypothetical protein